MSEIRRGWFTPYFVQLTEILSETAAQYTAVRDDKAAEIASAYLKATEKKRHRLEVWAPAPEIASQLIVTVGTVAALFSEHNYRGVLQQSFEIISSFSRLPGDLPSDPDEIPPPPGRED